MLLLTTGFSVFVQGVMDTVRVNVRKSGPTSKQRLFRRPGDTGLRSTQLKFQVRTSPAISCDSDHLVPRLLRSLCPPTEWTWTLNRQVEARGGCRQDRFWE